MRQRPWWWFPPPSSSYSPAPLPRSPSTHTNQTCYSWCLLYCARQPVPEGSHGRFRPRSLETDDQRLPPFNAVECIIEKVGNGALTGKQPFFFHGLRPHLAELKRRAAAGDTVRVDGSVPAVRGRKMMGGGCRVNVRCWGNNKWVIVTGLGTQQRALRSIRLTRAYYWKALPLIVDEEWYRL